MIMAKATGEHRLVDVVRDVCNRTKGTITAIALKVQENGDVTVDVKSNITPQGELDFDGQKAVDDAKTR